jgi:transcription-repair coupling factor (superfamily II helicase)
VAIRAAFKAVDNSKQVDIGSYTIFSTNITNFYRTIEGRFNWVFKPF